MFQGGVFILSANRFPVRSIARAPMQRDTAEPSLAKKLTVGVAISTAATFVSSFALSLLACALLNSSADPLSSISSVGTVLLMPSIFLGGFICSKRVKEAPLLCGIANGAAYSIIATILSLILSPIPSSGYAFFQHFLLRAVASLFSILGAMAGNVKRKSKKRRFG